MTEKENWDSESDDNEFGDTFLSEEASGNINMIIIPDYSHDKDEFIHTCLRVLSRCKTNDDALELLNKFYNQIHMIATIQAESEAIQDRAENLRFLVEEIL
ncbi:hypothetical protein EBB07_29465 [Paenibacillaceae bacterium]|nr:hypothetical protein EBB07_29465 [Paenibacillaceae bacterium]